MALKVFDLQCQSGHTFEGWFNSTEPFEKQLKQGLLSCPICKSTKITRKLSAPKLNLGRSESSSLDEPTSNKIKKIQAEALGYLRGVLNNTENVGDQFAKEALKIHNGEAKARSIKGTATKEERQHLEDEGVSVVPMPDFLDDDKLQ